jgi:uroporphyrinogen III methyltransferase/synthase
MKKGIVYLVGAGPGDPGLITLRGLECLTIADTVMYDRLIDRSLLTYARHAKLIDVGKQPDCHRFPQAEINAMLIEKAQAGEIVVRLKGGDPFVFGRGGEEATALAEAGLPFEIVPGVTSAIAAPAYAGIPITYRGVACSVTLATGHRAAFIEDPTCDWKHLGCGSDTLVLLMGVCNLPFIVQQLIAQGRSPDTPVALVERGTLANQKIVTGTLADIVELATAIRPPAAIIVGEVVQLRESLRWFDLPDRRPLLGLRVLNTRPLSQAEELSRPLMALGAQPVELPTSQILPVADSGPLDAAINSLQPALTQPRLGGTEGNGPAYDWVVFTSANCVSFFLNRLFALGHDVRALAGASLVAVDRITAEALREYGLLPDLIPTDYTGRDITTDIRGLAGQRVLMPCADIVPTNPSAKSATVEQGHNASLADALRDQGALLETVTAYTIRPVEPDLGALSVLLDGNLDVATFTSPCGVTPLTKMLANREVADVLSPLTVACVGPATAHAAHALGVRVDVVAEEHTIEGLVEALVKWRAGGKT